MNTRVVVPLHRCPDACRTLWSRLVLLEISLLCLEVLSFRDLEGPRMPKGRGDILDLRTPHELSDAPARTRMGLVADQSKPSLFGPLGEGLVQRLTKERASNSWVRHMAKRSETEIVRHWHRTWSHLPPVLPCLSLFLLHARHCLPPRFCWPPPLFAMPHLLAAG